MDSEDKIVRDDQVARRLKRGVEYIERNIADPMSLADVASEAALSNHHFHRLFRSRYGVRVMDYVRRRKLTQAAERLVRTGDPIIAIALDAGFESQSAFTRAFRRMFHATPASYRALGRDVPWLAVSALSEDVLATLPELRAGSPRLEAVQEFRVAGLSETFTGAARARIPELWNHLAGLVGAAAFQGGDRFGISVTPFAAIHGTFEYVAAMAIEADAPVPPGFAIWTIPSGAYLVFSFSGLPERLPAAIDYLFGVWLPGSDYTLRWGPSFERYSSTFVAGETFELELWFPVA